VIECSHLVHETNSTLSKSVDKTIGNKGIHIMYHLAMLYYTGTAEQGGAPKKIWRGRRQFPPENACNINCITFLSGKETNMEISPFFGLPPPPPSEVQGFSVYTL